MVILDHGSSRVSGLLASAAEMYQISLRLLQFEPFSTWLANAISAKCLLKMANSNHKNHELAMWVTRGCRTAAM